MSDKIKILILEDNQNDAELIQRALKKSGFIFSSEIVQTREEFENALDNFMPDIILSDYSLPSFDGVTAFHIKQKNYPDIPFIIVSGTIGEENTVELIKNGVTDYNLKDKLFGLTTKIIRALKEARDITERKKAEKTILQKNIELSNLSKHLQNIREQERTHIAREIHDELGQQLTAIKMDIDWVSHKQKNQDIIVVEKLQDMLSLCDAVIGTIRRIASDLRPGILDDLGLIAALEWKCSDFEERTGTPCKFISNAKERKFENNFSINAFRIMQETLTNVSRHAAANSVTVTVSENETELLLEVTDNGKGINNENIKSGKTLGITGMRERAALLGGELTITGTPNKGTITKLTLPFKNEYTTS